MAIVVEHGVPLEPTPIAPKKALAQQVNVVRATVARGRSIVVADAATRQAIGSTTEGATVYVTGRKTFTQDEEVDLPVDEVVALRASGYLIDPNKKSAPMQSGANVIEHAGSIINAPR